MTVVVIFGSPNSLNRRRDNSRMRSRVRRGAFCSIAGDLCLFSCKHNTDAAILETAGVAFNRIFSASDSMGDLQITLQIVQRLLEPGQGAARRLLADQAQTGVAEH